MLPGTERINRLREYEFFAVAGHDQMEKPIWTHDFANMQPLLKWNDRVGPATVTYGTPLRRYLMCVTHGPWPGQGAHDTCFLISEHLGPWKL